MEFFSWLNLGWVGSLIGIAGLILGIVLYVKSNKTTKPCYQYSTNIVVGKTDTESTKDIKILFKEKQVDNVKRTVIAIWNDGKHYLDKSVILHDKPLTISFDDGDILSHQVKSKTSEAIKSSTHLSDSGQVIVEFNYLDSKEGICLELLHTSSKNEPNISCTIKGVKSGFINKGKVTTKVTRKKDTITTYVTPILGLIFSLCGFFALHTSNMKRLGQEDFITKINGFLSSSITNPHDKDNFNGWVMILSGLAYIILPLYLKFQSRPKAPKNMDVY